MAKSTFNSRASINASPEKVAEILCSSTFLTEVDLSREEVVDAKYTLLEETENGMAFALDEVHYKHTKTGGLDKSGTSEHRAEYRFDKKNQTLSFNFGNTGKILVNGVYTLGAKEADTDLAFELNLDVRIPIIGKLIAGLMIKEMAGSFDTVVTGLKKHTS